MIKNRSNFKVVKIADVPVTASEYFNETALSFKVKDATPVSGYADMYLLEVNGADLVIDSLTLTLKDSVQNSNSGEAAYVANGSSIQITYKVSVDAIQADNIEVSEAAGALHATPQA